MEVPVQAWGSVFPHARDTDGGAGRVTLPPGLPASERGTSPPLRGDWHSSL